MRIDSAFTPEHVEALNAVDLRLFGVTHGITEAVGGITQVRGGRDEDFSTLLAATSELNAAHGDVLAIEPTGFMSDRDEDLTLAHIIPADISEVPVDDMSSDDIVAMLERGRRERRLNNLVYAAAHTALRGVTLRRAEVSQVEWELLGELLPQIAPPEAQNEIGLFYRNTKMLATLGSVASEMVAEVRGGRMVKPILLFASGRGHTPRLGSRLSASGVSFTSNP